MFAEVEITGPVVDPGFWDEYFVGIILLATALGAACLVPGALWWLVRSSRRTTASDLARAATSLSAPATAERAAPAPAAAGGGVTPAGRAGEKRGGLPSRRQESHNKRQHLRRKGQPLQVVVADGEGEGESPVDWVTDRSRGGLGIVIDRQIGAGTVLAVRPADAPDDVPWVHLQVRNCRPKGAKWYVGCKFTEELPWNVVLLFG